MLGVHLRCTTPFFKNRFRCVSVYLVQGSIFIVLLGEARGHHTPLVTLEKATSFNYFWQRGGGKVLQLHTHFKDTYNPSTPRSHSPSSTPHSNISFWQPLYVARLKVISRWNGFTWRELWSHSFVKSLESSAVCHLVGVKVHRQAVREWDQRPRSDTATVFTCKQNAGH